MKPSYSELREDYLKVLLLGAREMTQRTEAQALDVEGLKFDPWHHMVPQAQMVCPLHGLLLSIIIWDILPL